MVIVRCANGIPVGCLKTPPKLNQFARRSQYLCDEGAVCDDRRVLREPSIRSLQRQVFSMKRSSNRRGDYQRSNSGCGYEEGGYLLAVFDYSDCGNTAGSSRAASATRSSRSKHVYNGKVRCSECHLTALCLLMSPALQIVIWSAIATRLQPPPRPQRAAPHAGASNALGMLAHVCHFRPQVFRPTLRPRQRRSSLRAGPSPSPPPPPRRRKPPTPRAS